VLDEFAARGFILLAQREHDVALFPILWAAVKYSLAHVRDRERSRIRFHEFAAQRE
jgi:hypothetical protein